MESAKDIESYRKSVQRQRVHIFLARLDGEFKQIRCEILRKDPTLELEESYALVRREFDSRSLWNSPIAERTENHQALVTGTSYNRHTLEHSEWLTKTKGSRSSKKPVAQATLRQ
ncbi:hypothetical protein Lal_00041553 [Lupinus albus]|nr:hypothetical protein Lal_00041553 [Lupinus albus]